MRQAVASDSAPRSWGLTWIMIVVGTLGCTALVAWFNRIAGEPGNLLLVAMLAATLLFVIANGVRRVDSVRRKRAITASTDPLTGLHHRQAFMAAAEAYFVALHASGRPGGGALLVLDIDNLKAVNDAFDHEAGDRVIAEVAQVLRASVRSTDLVGRLGGEEFGLLLIGTDQVQSQMVADRLCRAVEALRFTVDDIAQPLSISVGIGLFRETTALPELIGSADQALYAAKQNGGNRAAISPIEPPKLAIAA